MVPKFFRMPSSNHSTYFFHHLYLSSHDVINHSIFHRSSNTPKTKGTLSLQAKQRCNIPFPCLMGQYITAQ